MTAGPAERLLAAWDTGSQIEPFSASGAFSLADGYKVAARVTALRQARGERMVGRKIGFTNRTIWPLYGVHAPLWGWIWDTTLHDIAPDGRIPLPPQAEPRLEPEIAFGFRASPMPGMTPQDLAACIDWVAHGVEIVVSVYPGWRFNAGDGAAAFGLHGAYFLGERRTAAEVLADVEAFSLTLQGPGEHLTGQATDVLDGPLHALAHLVEVVDHMPGAGPIQPGEVVTTGTLTDARPIARGQTWRTRLDGIDLPGLTLTFS